MANLPPVIVIPELQAYRRTQVDDYVIGGDFTVAGPPIPMPRPRFRLILRPVPRVMVWNPAENDQLLFNRSARSLMRGETFPLHGDNAKVAIGITFRFRRPDSHFRGRNRNLVILPRYLEARVTGGDVDNHVKYVLDALNGVLYDDDRQVVMISACKVWAEDPNSAGSTTVAVRNIE
jgi:Holliday junction resolvase RusA-like endonuclease